MTTDTNRDNYTSYSYWLEDAGEDLTPRRALAGSAEVDIAILGGGYSGLWTAYYLLQNQPSLKIAIIEKEIVGYGGSGRNGGWCSPRFPVSGGMLEKRYGITAARAQLLAIQDSVNEIRRVCDEKHISAQFHAGGTLTLARSAYQLDAIRASRATYERLGMAERYHLLSAEQASEHILVTKVHGALYTPDGARIHPGRLVRGLAHAVERLGCTIYEQTAVDSYIGGKEARVFTNKGEVRAKKAIIVAGEAYVTRLPTLHRAVLPVYSLICLTAPLTPAQWEGIGWQQGENVASARNNVVYLTKTSDGRILFGSRGAPYAFGSRITDAQDRDAQTIQLIQQSLFEWFPSLAGIPFTHAWGGPVAMPSDWMPSVRYDATSKIGFIGGYTGQGVSTSNLAGKLLAGLVTETASGLEGLPIAQRTSPKWIPEPLRWMIVRYMQGALLRIDEATEAGRRPPMDAFVSEYLGRH